MSSEPDHIERNRRRKNARRIAKQKFWREHDRESYVCPGCGSETGGVEWWEVHHKDGDPMNNDIENLVALCRTCHYREHDRTPPRSLDEWKDEFESYAENGESDYEPRHT